MAALADWLMLFSMQMAVLIVVAAIGEAGIAMPAAVRLTYWRAVLCGSLLLAPPSAMGVSVSALTVDARSVVSVVTSLETVDPAWRLSDVILLVWLGGVVASGTRLAVGLLALRRLRTAPDVRPVATALDGPDVPDPQRVGIWWHPGVTHPVSFGIRRPLTSMPAADSTAAPPLDFTARPAVVAAVAEAKRLSYGHLFNPAFATEVSLMRRAKASTCSSAGLRADELRPVAAQESGAPTSSGWAASTATDSSTSRWSIVNLGRGRDPLRGGVLKTLLDKLELIRNWELQMRTSCSSTVVGRLVRERVAEARYLAISSRRPDSDRRDRQRRHAQGHRADVLTAAQVRALGEREQYDLVRSAATCTEQACPRCGQAIDRRHSTDRLLPGYVRRFVTAAAAG